MKALITVRDRWVYSVVVARIATSLLLFFSPVIGTVLSFFFDWFDAYILIQVAGISRRAYHKIDKALDEVWSVCMLLVSLQSRYFFLLLFFFVYRLLGQFVFMKTGKTKWFMAFPNIFEFLFVWLILFVPLLNITLFYAIFGGVVVSIILKEMQEVFLHSIWKNFLESHKKTGYPKYIARFGWHRIGL